MACSTGKASKPTPKGEFRESTGPAGEWKSYNDGKYYVRYVFRIDGRILIHSIPYNEQFGNADKTYLAKLGTPLTAGSIMLSEENAKWIWDRCPMGTPVVIE